MTATTREQTSFRCRDDDGNETTATWRQLINVNDTQDVDTNYRIRFGITHGGMVGNTTAQLEYNLAGAGWNAVNAASSVVIISTSTGYTGTTTTEQLAQGKTFVTGEFEDIDGLTAAISITETEETEVEYCYQIRSADVTDAQTLQLRVTDAGTALTTYTNEPTITVNEPTSGHPRAMVHHMKQMAGT